MRGRRDLKGYQLAFQLAMEIFYESKTFLEERTWTTKSSYW